ncbi:serine/threonine-protein kinase [Streptomyces cyaneofuscatus]|uniref:serine/threonine-protein kinase n=1 Tax=Streptomyces cyaneofuscatus TaxID=66883 RepID=UPI0036510426
MAPRNGINKRELDKWAKNVVKEASKSLEQAQRRNPPRGSSQLNTNTSAGFGREEIEGSGYLPRLLMWLDVHAQQHPAAYVDVARFVEEHHTEDDEDPSVLALQLEQRGLVDIARDFAGTLNAHLTDEGRVAVHRLKNLQKDRAARVRYTSDAFLGWLFDSAGDQAPVDPAQFLATPGSFFAGAHTSAADLHQALAYLAEHSLIERIGTDPARVTVTSEGASCVLAGDGVRDRIRSLRTGTIDTDALPRSEGTIVGQRQGAAQVVHDRFGTLNEAPGTNIQSATAQSIHKEVPRQATGDPKAYRRDKFPLPGSNQADVFRATHKTTGIVVALKQLRVKSSGGMRAARMKREIEAGKALMGHRHAIPILDHGADYTWFVMPWADSTAEDHREDLQDSRLLRRLVDALISVLAEAHRLGWVHRDIKPPNILLLEGRWVLADWGTVRRPAGQTTKVDRTRSGIGTEGFSAPELFSNPDQRPQPSSDIYSVGRMIAWALTGNMPLPNKQLLPLPGPWRNIVRAATQEDPSRRPQSVGELVGLIEREHAEMPVDPLERAVTLLKQANSGDGSAADAFLTLLTDHVEDFELHAVQLPQLEARLAAQTLGNNLTYAQTVLQALTDHVGGADTRRVEYMEATQVTVWLQSVADHAAREQQWDLMEEAMQAMCTWDGAWDQWDARDVIGPWLRSLKDDAASVAAAVLHDHSESAEHFSHFADDRTVDPRIRRAVSQV